MRLKFIMCDRGSFSGGLLPFLPVCCRDRAWSVSTVRTIRDYGKSDMSMYQFRSLRLART
ncbi:plasmid mobilization protein [Escherichia coli]|nr:plasmid mobilization protein [Escherichia coli]